MGKPTMDHVAERAGVSRALVSLVMRDSPRVSDKSRDKVLAAASELGYRPNASARNLASGQTNTIGVMLNDLHNPYFTEIAEGAAFAAGENGFQILINSGWERESGEISAIEALLSMRTDGILLGAPDLGIELLEDFARQTALVAVSMYSRPDSFDTVSNHEEHGANLIVDHLVDLGHERIAHIEAGEAAGGTERRTAFIDAMVARGLAPIMVSGDFHEASGYEGARQLMKLHELPTAIYAPNDLAAVGVLTYLSEHGIAVPDEVSVVGYDDSLLASIGTISLTTVHQPRQQIGQMAMEILLERIGGRTEARHEFIEPRLVARASTGRARK